MKKKNLIYVTGSADSPFFLNEILELINHFDKVIVIQINGKNIKDQAIAEKYGISISSIDLKNILFHLPKLALWRMEKDTHDEIKRNVGKKSGIKRLAYIYLYGITRVLINNMIDGFLNDYEDFYLYSFWLSRGAYAISGYHGNKNVRKMVARAHGYDVYEERNSMKYLPFRDYIDRQLDYIFFVSNNGCHYFTDKMKGYSGNRSKKRVLHLGTVRGGGVGWHKNQNELVIASCSMINKVKRIDLIIDYLCSEAFLDVKLRWIHIGTGELESKIKKYAEDKLTIPYKMYGEVENSQILEIYKKENVDFFINMSDSEGMPVSIMEAMSCGIPVIARPVGGIPEIVKENETGVLLKQNDICQEEMNDSAKKVLEIKCSGDWDSYSKRAYAEWSRKFNSKDNTQKMINIMLQEENDD